MKKRAQEIAEQIKKLVDQLAAVATGKSSVGKPLVKATTKAKKGASGALSILMEEGFFDTPKSLSEIISKLEEIGHWHKKPAIAMNLLNLTKRRTLNRIKDNETKKWKYVIRR